MTAVMEAIVHNFKMELKHPISSELIEDYGHCWTGHIKKPEVHIKITSNKTVAIELTIKSCGTDKLVWKDYEQQPETGTKIAQVLNILLTI